MRPATRLDATSSPPSQQDRPGARMRYLHHGGQRPHAPVWLVIVVEMLADELEPQGIRVNGFIAGRCGTSDGLAHAATFVLSPAASCLTGNVITIDGGDGRGHLAGVF